MQTLMLNHKFIKKLDTNSDAINVLKLYGFKDKDIFLKKVIEKLNKEYDYLNIENYKEMDKAEERIYKMFNGYIKGEFENYKEITISFSDLQGKEGNVVITQQLMPMLQSKIESNPLYMFDEKNKHIFMLTTHKSNILAQENNSIKTQSISTIQILVKSLNNLGFDVIPFINIKNLNTDSKYNSLQEYIDNLDFLTQTKLSNNQHRSIRKEGRNIIAEIVNNPIGQEEKYFSFRYLTALMLNNGYKYDMTKTLKKTTSNQIKALQLMTEKVNMFNIITPYNDEEIEEYKFEEIISSSIESDVSNEPIIGRNKSGRIKYITKKLVKEQKFKDAKYICECNDDSHIYFISETSNKNYVEGHHIIPMEFQRMYWEQRKKNLDVLQNVVPLCPHCHKKIHHGTKEAKLEVIKLLYDKNINKLKEIDENLDMKILSSYYNVY